MHHTSSTLRRARCSLDSSTRTWDQQALGDARMQPTAARSVSTMGITSRRSASQRTFADWAARDALEPRAPTPTSTTSYFTNTTPLCGRVRSPWAVVRSIPSGRRRRSEGAPKPGSGSVEIGPGPNPCGRTSRTSSANSHARVGDDPCIRQLRDLQCGRSANRPEAGGAHPQRNGSA